MMGVRQPSKVLATTFVSEKTLPVFSGSLGLNVSVLNLGRVPDVKLTLAQTSASNTPLVAGLWKVLLNASALPAGPGIDAMCKIRIQTFLKHLGTPAPYSTSVWPTSTSSLSL